MQVLERWMEREGAASNQFYMSSLIDQYQPLHDIFGRGLAVRDICERDESGIWLDLYTHNLVVVNDETLHTTPTNACRILLGS